MYLYTNLFPVIISLNVSRCSNGAIQGIFLLFKKVCNDEQEDFMAAFRIEQ